MKSAVKAAVLNAGESAWIFEPHANHMAHVLGVPVQDTPAAWNYVLGWDDNLPLNGKSFVPLEAMRLASDKRLLAQCFLENDVATPRTILLDTETAVRDFLVANRDDEWVLKWPTGCGATGHRLLSNDSTIPHDWPRPFIVQQFIRLDQPEVYRLYAVANETFGWNARRFPKGAKVSPFVAHAQGARYEDAGKVPHEAEVQARRAMAATQMLSSFGCADLMCNEKGEWLVLEGGTDGLWTHVDRDIKVNGIEAEIDARLAQAFGSWLSKSSVSGA